VIRYVCPQCGEVVAAMSEEEYHTSNLGYQAYLMKLALPGHIYNPLMRAARSGYGPQSIIGLREALKRPQWRLPLLGKRGVEMLRIHMKALEAEREADE
jgi:hypothetical protein